MKKLLALVATIAAVSGFAQSTVEQKIQSSIGTLESSLAAGTKPVAAAGITGTLADGNIPASIARDTEVTAATDAIEAALAAGTINSIAWQARSNLNNQSLTVPFLKTINVMEPRFGVTGNGTTDDHTGITNAVTELWAQGGGKLVFPIGTYRTSKKFMLPSNTTVEMDWLGTRIQQTDGAAQGTPIFHILNQTNITIRGGTLDGNWRNRGLTPINAEDVGVYLQWGTNILFEGVTFYDFGKDGVNYDFSELVWTERCRFDRCLASGISTDGHRIYVLNNDFVNCGWGGFVGPHPGAIGDVDSREIVVMGNTFRTNYISVFKDGGTDWRFIGNSFWGTNDNCTNLLIRGTTDGIAANNVMRGGTAGRIYNNSTRVRIIGNTVDAHNGFIQDTQTGDSYIEYAGNKIRYIVAATSMKGFDIQSTKANGIGTVIKGNVIASYGNGIRVATGVNRILITDNELVNGAQSSLVFEGSSGHHVITDNRWLNQFNTSMDFTAITNSVIRGGYCAAGVNVGASSNNVFHGLSLGTLSFNTTAVGTNMFTDIEVRGVLYSQTADRIPYQLWGFGIRGTNNTAPVLGGAATLPVCTYPLAAAFPSLTVSGAASFGSLSTPILTITGSLNGNGGGLTNVGGWTRYNVKLPPFNAVGDYVANDTAALQAAATKAANTSLADSGEFFLPTGAYVVNNSILFNGEPEHWALDPTFKSGHYRITGSKMAIIKQTANTNTVQLVNGMRNVKIDSLYLWGTNANRASSAGHHGGLYLNGSGGHLTVDDFYASEFVYGLLADDITDLLVRNAFVVSNFVGIATAFKPDAVEIHARYRGNRFGFFNYWTNATVPSIAHSAGEPRISGDFGQNDIAIVHRAGYLHVDHAYFESNGRSIQIGLNTNDAYQATFDHTAFSDPVLKIDSFAANAANHIEAWRKATVVAEHCSWAGSAFYLSNNWADQSIISSDTPLVVVRSDGQPFIVDRDSRYENGALVRLTPPPYTTLEDFNWVSLREEFAGGATTSGQVGQLGWTTSGSIAASTASTTDWDGKFVATTAASSNSIAYFYLNSGGLVGHYGTNFVAAFRFKIPNTNNVTAVVGFQNYLGGYELNFDNGAGTARRSAGAFLVFTNNNQFRFETRGTGGAVGASSLSTVAANQNWNELVMTRTNTTLYLAVNGETFVAPSPTGLNNPSHTYTPVFGIATGDGTAKSIIVDFWSYYSRRNRTP